MITASALKTEPWLQFSVQNYFATFDWDHQASPIQQFALSTASAAPIGMPSLDWSVNQFFGSVNWEGGSAALAEPPAELPAELPAEADDSLMFSDFADLFG
jgi:hypothetical protein